MVYLTSFNNGLECDKSWDYDVCSQKAPFINKNMLKISTFLEILNILCETLNIFVKVIVNLILFTFCNIIS
jgi:hypothetical protein